MARQFFQAYGTADGNSGILDVEFQRKKAEKSGILGLKIFFDECWLKSENKCQ